MSNLTSQQFLLRALVKSRVERDNRSATEIAPLTLYRRQRGKLPKADRRESAGALFNRGSTADRLHANLDAAVCKHTVLGLIFLKYVSDSFAMRQREIEAQLRGPASDYYIEKNVFWVPALARWKTLQDSAKLPTGTEIAVTGERGHPARTDRHPAGRPSYTYKITSTGKHIDDALDAVEKENPNQRDRLCQPRPTARAVALVNISRRSPSSPSSREA
jgi:hypothetical protein